MPTQMMEVEYLRIFWPCGIIGELIEAKAIKCLLYGWIQKDSSSRGKCLYTTCVVGGIAHTCTCQECAPRLPLLPNPQVFVLLF
jgi:hypothetical protein